MPLISRANVFILPRSTAFCYRKGAIAPARIHSRGIHQKPMRIASGPSDAISFRHPIGRDTEYKHQVNSSSHTNKRVSPAPITQVQLQAIPRAIQEKLRRPSPKEPSAAVVDGGELEAIKLSVGEMSRTVHFYIPNEHLLSRREPGKIPLLIALHGATEHGLLFRSSSTSYAYDELACREGFIVAYPDGYEGNWNDGRVASNFPAANHNIDDVGFVKEIIAHAAEKLNTDPNKTLVAGWSNGGQFALRLLYDPEAPNIAGLAVHCVNLPVQENNKIKIVPSYKTRVPVAIVNGTADPITRIEGGELVMVRLPGGRALGERGLHMSSKETANTLANNWGADADITHEVTTISSDMACEDWVYDGRPVVRLVSMLGEGHHVSVPDGSDLPLFLGPALKKVHAPLEVIKFFKTATNALS